MPHYIMMLKFTDQGVRNIKESPSRLDAFKRSLTSVGAELRDYHVAMGAYDVIMTVSAPDDTVAAKIALSLSALGNVRTETHRVFTEEEYRKIIGTLP